MEREPGLPENSRKSVARNSVAVGLGSKKMGGETGPVGDKLDTKLSKYRGAESLEMPKSICYLELRIFLESL